MLPVETRLLRALLEQVKTKENGWVPDECLAAFHDLTVTPVLEITFWRGTATDPEFLLELRDDQHWHGWHINGGLVKVSQPASLADMCQAIADRELPGIRIAAVQLVTAFKWPEHPWCHPLSIVCLCETAGSVPETETRRFFVLGRLPVTVPHHADFLKQCAEMIRTGRAIVHRPQSPETRT